MPGRNCADLLRPVVDCPTRQTARGRRRQRGCGRKGLRAPRLQSQGFPWGAERVDRNVPARRAQFANWLGLPLTRFARGLRSEVDAFSQHSPANCGDPAAAGRPWATMGVSHAAVTTCMVRGSPRERERPWCSSLNNCSHARCAAQQLQAVPQGHGSAVECQRKKSASNSTGP